MRVITRTIWILSLISLFNDMASEMLYPVLPVYLESIGFSVVLIGVLEGIAEATAGISKGYFGSLSDITGKRVPFVRWGYALSAISKPLLGLFANVWLVFTSRTLDKLGKGIRTGARDAMLSDEATHATKGKIFGFHRSMDTFGAVLGPSIALLYLSFFPADYKTLFLLIFIPGLLTVASTFFLRDKNKTISSQKKASFFTLFRFWKSGPRGYKKVVAGLLFFALFNSSDVFLLLQVKQSGFSDTTVIGLYIFYNLIYALTSYPLGILADKTGLRNMFMASLVLFALVYTGMAFLQSVEAFVVLFFVYGLFAAASEGISKAWISNLVSEDEVATAIGTYAGFQSLSALLASSLAGFIWYTFNAETTFAVTATASVVTLLYFLRMKDGSPEPRVKIV